MDKNHKKALTEVEPGRSVSGKVLLPIEKKELDISIIKRFTKIAIEFPNKLAIKDDVSSYTYSQVEKMTSQLGNEIKSLIEDNSPIGIALPNNALFPIAMLAALSAGIPYVPLDLYNPTDRNNLILDHSSVKYLIVEDISSDFPATIKQIPIREIVERNETGTKTNDLSFGKSLAYIIYTSGSTGIPKGVYQNQENLLHDVLQYISSIELTQHDRLTLLYSPSVGGAIRDIFGALLSGASLHILPLRKTGIRHLPEFLSKERITIYHSIPTIFRTLMSLQFDTQILSTIRIVYLAGDRIFKSDIDLFKKYFPDNAAAYIGIGATEVATIYHQWFIYKNTTCESELIPLGFSVPDRKTEIIYEKGDHTGPSEVGEIKVISKHISLGYWNDEKQTNEKFLFDGEEERSFLTGDLGRINNDGMLEFIGRKDNLVKINGHRIELSEIEACTMSMIHIKDAAVIQTSSMGIPCLALFYVSDQIIDPNYVRHQIQLKLPFYMMPRYVLQLNEIPLLSNFKRDNISLQTLLNEKIINSNKDDDITSDNDLIEKIKMIWISFLGNDSFEKNISWNDAGGDSISLVHMVVQLESALGIKIPNDWIISNLKPTDLISKVRNFYDGKRNHLLPKLYYFPPMDGISQNGRDLAFELSMIFKVIIIKYPDLESIKRNEITEKELSDFLYNQIPEYNSENINYLGNCTGVNFMKGLLKNYPLEQYGFIGIIDGLNEVASPSQEPFIKLYVKHFNYSFLFPKKIIDVFRDPKKIRAYYYNYAIFRKTKKLWFPLLNNSVKNEILLDLMLFDFGMHNFKYNFFIQFCSEQNRFFQTSEKPTYKSENYIYVKLKGGHGDVLKEENRKIIIEYLLSAINGEVG